jgi:hypothetical protein
MTCSFTLLNQLKSLCGIVFPMSLNQKFIKEYQLSYGLWKMNDNLLSNFKVNFIVLQKSSFDSNFKFFLGSTSFLVSEVYDLKNYKIFSIKSPS